MSDWWLIGLTGGIVIFTALLWWSTRGLVRSAEKTAQHQLQAYVGVKVETHPIIDNPALEATLVFTNYGQTPAYDVDFAFAFTPLDYPNSPIVERRAALYGDLGKSQYILWPQAEFRLQLNYHPDDQTRGEIRNGQTKRLFAFGEVRYKDVYEATRFTRFCFFYGGGQSSRTGRMHLYSTGNEADRAPEKPTITATK